MLSDNDYHTIKAVCYIVLVLVLAAIHDILLTGKYFIKKLHFTCSLNPWHFLGTFSLFSLFKMQATASAPDLIL